MNKSVFESFPHLETERLKLRKVTVEDIPMVFEFNSDPEAVKYVPREPYTHLDEALEKVAGFNRGYEEGTAICWAYTRKDSGVTIGYGCLFHVDAEGSKAEIGYGILRPFWGQGFVSEAVAEMTRFAQQDMQLHRVYGLVDPDNIPSAKILLKLGYSKEGCLRHNDFARGNYFDMDVFGLISE